MPERQDAASDRELSPVAALGRWAEEEFRELWLYARRNDDAYLERWANARLRHLDRLGAEHREANP